jgi:proteasome lid subunit RPN8/RPN11
MIEFINEIQEHFVREYPKEGCGVLAVSKGKLGWYPCNNVAQNRDDFILDSKQYMKLSRTMDIVGIIHSHPDKSPEPSLMDKKYCNALGIKYYIFSYPDMELFVLEPEDNITTLYGREYEFGVSDCFEASRDYLASVGINIPKRIPFEDNWWEKGLDYFSEEHLNEWNFNKVDEPQPNDLLIFKVAADAPNHCGVYIGNDIFYHHAVNRLSCREHLYPMWANFIHGIYRYEA